MKATAAQLGAALDRPGGDIRIFLLHGPDESGALDYVARLARAMAGAERVDLDGAMLKARPGLLADEAASMSLFGDRRYVRVSAMGEESGEALALLLDAPTAGNPVIAIAPTAKATGKLIKAAIASPRAMAMACYPLEGQAATRLAAAIARDHGVRLSGDTPQMMIDAAGGDRAVLTREIEKLALYLDAAPDRPVDATAADLAAVGAALDDVAMHDAIEAIVAGRPAALGPELAALEAANMAIPLLRGLVRRLMTLAEMRGDLDGGASIDDVIARHRIFWKEKDNTIAAVRRWSAAQLAQAITRARRAERAIMFGGAGGSVAAQYDLMAIARSAARR